MDEVTSRLPVGVDRGRVLAALRDAGTRIETLTGQSFGPPMQNSVSVTTFGLPFVELGLVPENASSVLLPRTIGRAHAGAALYLGETIDAVRACADGIVTKIVEDDELDKTALAAANAVAAKPRRAAVRRSHQASGCNG